VILDLLLLGLAEEGSLLVLGSNCKLSVMAHCELKDKFDRMKKLCSESNYLKINTDD
jgi:hypothetical protein